MELSSVLVAVSGEASDDNVVRLACEVLNSSGTKLHILYVIEVDRALPVDAEIPPATAKGEEVLKHIDEIVKPYKCQTAPGELVQSRHAGYAVVQEAVDKQVDAILLGVPYKRRHGSFSLGRAIPYVLEHAPCKVILWREHMATDRSNNGIPR